jgi:hypothetical protein
MPEGIEAERGIGEKFLGGWRIVASAWLIAIIFMGLFAGVEALASFHKPSPREAILAGVMIPRHDSGFVGPGEVAASDWLERARAEAYTGW